MQWSVSEPYFVLLMSWSPKIAHKWFCILNLHLDLSFQGEKNYLKIRFLVAEILIKNRVSFFLGRPVWSIRFNSFWMINNLIPLNLLPLQFMHNFSIYNHFRGLGNIPKWYLILICSYFRQSYGSHLSNTINTKQGCVSFDGDTDHKTNPTLFWGTL